MVDLSSPLIVANDRLTRAMVEYWLWGKTGRGRDGLRVDCSALSKIWSNGASCRSGRLAGNLQGLAFFLSF